MNNKNNIERIEELETKIQNRHPNSWALGKELRVLLRKVIAPHVPFDKLTEAVESAFVADNELFVMWEIRVWQEGKWDIEHDHENNIHNVYLDGYYGYSMEQRTIS